MFYLFISSNPLLQWIISSLTNTLVRRLFSILTKVEWNCIEAWWLSRGQDNLLTSLDQCRFFSVLLELVSWLLANWPWGRMDVGWPIDSPSLRLKCFPGMERSVLKLEKSWASWDQVVTLARWENGVSQSTLSQALDYSTRAIFSSEEVHVPCGHTTGGKEGKEATEVRTLAERCYGSCRDQEAQPHPSKYQPPGTMEWDSVLESLVRTQAWHKK